MNNIKNGAQLFPTKPKPVPTLPPSQFVYPSQHTTSASSTESTLSFTSSVFQAGSKNSSKKMPLFVACEKGDAKAVQALLADPSLDVNQPARCQAVIAVVDVTKNEPSNLNESLKALTMNNSKPEGVDRLLGNGITSVNVVQSREDGMTPLFMACQQGHLEVVKLLLACDKIDVNKTMLSVGFTPLFVVCQQGRLELIKLLLAHDGIDVNKAETSGGVTPLYMACQQGHLEVVRQLLAHDGIDVNQAETNGGATPFYRACQQGHLEVVKQLLAHDRIDVNQATRKGVTPLYRACEEGHSEVIRVLLSDKRVNIETPYYGVTPFDKAQKKGVPKDVLDLFLSRNTEKK
jgi:ankyrin repeat protein